MKVVDLLEHGGGGRRDNTRSRHPKLSGLQSDNDDKEHYYCDNSK